MNYYFFFIPSSEINFEYLWLNQETFCNAYDWQNIRKHWNDWKNIKIWDKLICTNSNRDGMDISYWIWELISWLKDDKEISFQIIEKFNREFRRDIAIKNNIINKEREWTNGILMPNDSRYKWSLIKISKEVFDEFVKIGREE